MFGQEEKGKPMPEQETLGTVKFREEAIVPLFQLLIKSRSRDRKIMAIMLRMGIHPDLK